MGLLLLTLALAGCAAPGIGPAPPTGPPPAGFYPLVRLGTDHGDIWFEVYDEMVPATAENFLQYARNHFYEGTKFHRVIGPEKQPPTGFMIQGGDPNTKDPSKGRDTWGQGQPGLARIPDEYTRALRFDGPGVVGMARPSEPNSASSQFFITLSAQPALDDKYAAFGRVVRGMEVVRAIGNAKTSAAPVADVPVEDIGIVRTEVVDAVRNASQVRAGLNAWAYQQVWNATGGRGELVSVVVENTGNLREEVNASLEVPSGWTWALNFPDLPAFVTIPQAYTTRIVPANGSEVFSFRVTPANDSAGDVPFRAVLRSGPAEASVPLVLHLAQLGAEAVPGTNVTLHYTGMLTDGRLFDADRYALTANASIHTFPDRLTFDRAPERYRPLSFILDNPDCQKPVAQRPPGTNCVVTGFSDGARGLRVGESRTVLVPPENGYGTAACGPLQQTCLSGKWLIFIVELLRAAPP
ncbi:MAG: peptidylprolyl isomerase [Halobacteriales archaeon]|nr:peptidylprolyl isomerase [Halobacteriales archaeon]